MLDETKEPCVLVAPGSFSPVTYLHLRCLDMARYNTPSPGTVVPGSDEAQGLCEVQHELRDHRGVSVTCF